MGGAAQIRMASGDSRRSRMVGRMAQEKTLPARHREPHALLARILLRKLLRHRRPGFRPKCGPFRSHAITHAAPRAPCLVPPNLPGPNVCHIIEMVRELRFIAIVGVAALLGLVACSPTQPTRAVVKEDS